MRIITCLIAIVVFFVVSASTCTKKDRLCCMPYTTLTYAQTQCADPWGYATSDSSTILKIRQYLDSLGLEQYVISCTISTENPGAVCAACSCVSGKTVHLNVQKGTESHFSKTVFK